MSKDGRNTGHERDTHREPRAQGLWREAYAAGQIALVRERPSAGGLLRAGYKTESGVAGWA